MSYIFVTLEDTYGEDDVIDPNQQPNLILTGATGPIITGNTEFPIPTIISLKTKEVTEVPVGNLGLLVEKRFEKNTFFSGFTGPNINILISVNQKIKDLGIYSDVNQFSSVESEVDPANIVDNIIDNLNIFN